MLQLLAVLQTKTLHHLRHALSRPEIEHQLVFKTDEKDAFSRIPLTGAATAQLTVRAPGFMALGTHHHQPAKFGHTSPQLDVRPPPSHVRRHCDRPFLTGRGHNLRLLLVKFRVEHRMRDFFALQHA